MKILWFLAAPYGEFGKAILGEGSKISGGPWIEAAAKVLLDYAPDSELCFVSTAAIKDTVTVREGNRLYHCFHFGSAYKLEHYSDSMRKEMANFVNQYNPDIIQFWGTETPFNLAAAETCDKVKSVVLIQGLINAICKYPNGNISAKEMCGRELLSWLQYGRYNKTLRLYEKHAENERRMLSVTKNVIADTDWCEMFVRSINKNIKCHRVPLQINEQFSKVQWDPEHINRHSLFCIAERGGYKGLHIAIKAMVIVAREIPDVTLTVPGSDLSKIDARRNVYIRYLRRLIKNTGMEDRVRFTGPLNAEQMAEHLSTSHVFIMPSCIENQSSSLREACAVGTPSISSYAGGALNFLSDKVNGFIYRYEEYEILSQRILQLFGDDELARRLSCEARKLFSDMYSQDGGRLLYETYVEILKDNR